MEIYQKSFENKFGKEAWEEYKNIVSSIENEINYSFNNKKLLYDALTIPASGLLAKENQRLEFLGDAILDAVVARILYNKYPDFEEGKLSTYKSHLTENKNLGNLSPKIGITKIGPILNVGKLTGAKAGDLFEAVVGAIYVDSGYNHNKIYDWINEFMNFDEIIETISNSPWQGMDAKSYLHRVIQKKYKNNAEIEYLSRNLGTQDSPEFEVTVIIKKTTGEEIDRCTAKKTARKKKDAQRIACEDLLNKWKEEGKLNE